MEGKDGGGSGVKRSSEVGFSNRRHVILDTGINCDFRSLRPCVLDLTRRRKDAKGIVSIVTSVVVIQPTIKKSSICGGAKYNATVFESFS